MKKTLDHLHLRKQKELETIVEIIRNAARVEMIILFGSYARGDFVEYDFRYDDEEGHTTSYESDFDIMVIVKDERKPEDFKIWHKVENQIRRNIRTPVTLIVEVSQCYSPKEEALRGGSKRGNIVKARSIYCCLSSQYLGTSGEELSRKLKMTPAAISSCIKREERMIAEDEKLIKAVLS